MRTGTRRWVIAAAGLVVVAFAAMFVVLVFEGRRHTYSAEMQTVCDVSLSVPAPEGTDPNLLMQMYVDRLHHQLVNPRAIELASTLVRPGLTFAVRASIVRDAAKEAGVPSCRLVDFLTSAVDSPASEPTAASSPSGPAFGRKIVSDVSCRSVKDCWLDDSGTPIKRPARFKNKPLPRGDCDAHILWLRNELRCEQSRCTATFVSDSC